MSTYLVAMYITDFKFVEKTYKSGDRCLQVRFWGRQKHLPYLKHMIPIVPKMFQYMETYLKQQFSLPKLDFIAPLIQMDFAGMENWGLVVFEYYYLKMISSK